jgi:hypothetical protein
VSKGFGRYYSPNHSPEICDSMYILITLLKTKKPANIAFADF